MGRIYDETAADYAHELQGQIESGTAPVGAEFAMAAARREAAGHWHWRSLPRMTAAQEAAEAERQARAEAERERDEAVWAEYQRGIQDWRDRTS